MELAESTITTITIMSDDGDPIETVASSHIHFPEIRDIARRSLFGGERPEDQELEMVSLDQLDSSRF